MIPEEQNKVLDAWQTSARYWDKYRTLITKIFAPLTAALGAKSVIERNLNFEIKAPISFEQFWQIRSEMSGALREKMARLSPTQLPTIKQAAAEAAREYFVSGTMSFPAEALIVSGTKSTI